MALCNTIVPVNVGTWQDWNPTFINFTLGNGTINLARYTQLGTTVHGHLCVTLGSTSTMGVLQFYLPVPPGTPAVTPIGEVSLIDTSASADFGAGLIISGTTGYVTVWTVNGTYMKGVALASTVPMTWATGDAFRIYFTYEAA